MLQSVGGGLDRLLAPIWVQTAFRYASGLAVGIMAGGVVNSVTGTDGVDWPAIFQLKATYVSLALVGFVSYVEYRASGFGRAAREAERVEAALDRLTPIFEAMIADRIKAGEIADMKTVREMVKSR